jgi:hypothetical protein
MFGYVKESAVRDEITRLTQIIEGDPDPLTRLAYASLALNGTRSHLVRLRNASAYAARLRYSAVDIEKAIGVNRALLAEWVRDHRVRTGDPAPPRYVRRDLDEAVDLSGLPSTRRGTPIHPTS